uniref:Uncharacterized protein n=1 Tax=Tanacetum cinerariifolium TaxID=118510 RepID=A0A699J570_TANCI|nr:hypothetical protein [Tanacetum cinerariifolium]
MDVDIEQNDLNQKFLTSLSPEWLMYTIVWRNRNDLDTLSLDDVYNRLKVYEPEVQKKSKSSSQNMAFISSANTSSGNGEVNTASILTASTQVSPGSANVVAASISHDTNMALLSMRAARFWKKTRKKITIQGTDVVVFDKSKGSMVEESAPKALMDIDGVGWDWSYMANEEENHALVADDDAPTEFTLMAKSSSSSKNEIRGLEFDVKNKNIKIENLMNELEQIKKEKEGLGSKLTGFESASKDLDTLLGSQRSDKNKEGFLEYADDIITDYSRPSPSIKSNSSDLQNNNSSVSEHGESSESIMSKPMIKFVKATDSPTVIKTNKGETVRKPSVKTPIRVNRPNINVAQPKRTSFAKPAHSYVRRPFQRKSAVRTQFRVPRVSTAFKTFPTVDSKVSTAKSTFTAGMGNKGKAVKASACWIWRPKQNTIDKGLNSNSGNSQNNIDDKGYWDSGCSRHITGNISYLSDYEPYDGGYVSF